MSCGGRVDRFFRFALRVTDVGAFEYDPPSVLSHFEAADLLDALSIGVVVLDAHLCVIYANVAAQDALAFRVDQARGRPIGDFLGHSNRLVTRLQRALETGQSVADRERPLSPDVTITPLGSQVTGVHLLLQFAHAAQPSEIAL